MAQTTKQYGEVWGPITGVRRPKEGQQDDKTYVSIKSLSTGKFVSVTVWDNSHGSYIDSADPQVGDLAYASGSIQKNQGNDGKTYLNMSAYQLLFFKTNRGEDTSTDSTEDDSDAPEVM